MFPSASNKEIRLLETAAHRKQIIMYVAPGNSNELSLLYDNCQRFNCWLIQEEKV